MRQKLPLMSQVWTKQLTQIQPWHEAKIGTGSGVRCRALLSLEISFFGFQILTDLTVLTGGCASS